MMLENVKMFVASILVAAHVVVAIGSYPIGDARNCFSASPLTPAAVPQPLYSLDVLPGLGYDALRDIDMGPVLNYNYSLCQVSKDGKYLLPDNIYLTPIRRSSIEQFAEFYDHWSKVTSLTSSTISAHASASWSFATVSTSFSLEHSTTKSHMVNDDSSVVRIHLRNSLYTVHAKPHSPLHPDFKSRLFEIGAYLERNLTDHARYLAELMVRDYGTHYLSSVEAGAIIVQTDFIKNQFTEDKSSDRTKIKASASATFFAKFSVGTGYSSTSDHTHDESYRSNQTFSKVDTYGGPPFRTNYTIDQWEDGIAGALAPIDRSGDPLHFAINLDTVPELPDLTRVAIKNIVYEATKRYFKVNTHAGCTDPQSKQFDLNANVDDSSCLSESNMYSNYTFGGIYQVCTGDQKLCQQYDIINQANPLTHGYSCPDNSNYIPIKIFTGQIDIKKYHTFLHWRSYHDKATYDTYWCAARPGADIPADSGFLFGGFYSVARPNPVTNTMGCPQYYVPLKIGNYMNLCVSRDFELGYKYSVPFGGFETCLSGNPQARERFNEDPNSWPHECPHGYTSYFGGVEHGCDINLCVKSGVLASLNYKQILPTKLPPFHVHVQGELNNTDSLTFTGSDGEVWSRSWSGEWSNMKPAVQCLADTTVTEEEFTVQTGATTYTTSDTGTTENITTPVSTTNPPGNSIPLQSNGGPSVVAITVPTVLFGVLIVCVIAVIVLVFVRRVYKRERHGYNNMQLVNDQASDTPA